MKHYHQQDECHDKPCLPDWAIAIFSVLVCLVGSEAVPAKLILALPARHVLASPVLLDQDPASGAGLLKEHGVQGAERLRIQRKDVFCIFQYL